MIENLKERLPLYFSSAHQNAKDKGFWEDHKTNKEKKVTMLALVLCEAAEVIEAIRKPKPDLSTNVDETENFNEWYKLHIKGTVGEEIADILIRLFDYCQGYDLKPNTVIKYINKEMDALKGIIIKPESFVFFIMRSITDIHFGSFGNEVVGEVMAKCFKLAEHYNIDIWRNIDLKMKYNALRPYKHNKAF